METLKAIAKRKSTRSFKLDQIPEAILDTILDAGCAAPVGHGEYDALRITVVQDKEMLDRIREVAMDCFRDPIRDIYYGAPTAIIISARQGELAMANAACIANTMLLAATDLGIDNIYIWGTVLAFRDEPELAEEIGLPEDYMPIASIALGYAENPDPTEKPWQRTIQINRV